MNSLIDIKNKQLIFNGKNVFMIIDENNNPWFRGKDVSEILGYSNFKKALINHVNEKYKLNLSNLIGTQNGSQLNYHKGKAIFISEPGLYELIFSSRLPIALEFKSWVFEEVLPSIRKHGEYKIKDEVIKFYSEEINKIVEHKNNIIKIKDNYINRLEYITENAQETARIAVDVINHRNGEIKNMKPNVVPQTQNKNLLNMFALYRTYDPDNYAYFVIRCQRRNFNSRANEMLNRFPNMKRILKFTYNPNSINLYNRMKETLKDEINWKRNFFDITDEDNYYESDLIFDIKRLHNPFSKFM